MAQVSPMNGGNGIYSYAMNSSIEKNGFINVKEAIKKAVTENLDVKALLSGTSTAFNIVDLGCATGPNTFLAMQTLVEMVQDKYVSQGLDSQNLEFQVFLNDLITNDFNTLFTYLPCERKYFVAGVPGSFYSRLFPSSSIHLAYSSCALIWLSETPNESQIKNSEAWNEGRIHYTGAHDAVVKAYANQFEKDIEVFLSARAEEIVQGGMMVIHMPGVPDGTVTHDFGIALDFFGSILMDMVKEGLLEQDKVDTFNFPHVYPSITVLTRLIEKNGCFRIVMIELGNLRKDTKVPINAENTIMNFRALVEETILNHLGNDHKITDEIFTRAMQQKTKFAHMMYSAGVEIGCQLFTVLQRK